MSQIIIKNITELPAPHWVKTCQLDSGSAHKHQSDLIQIFRLPLTGEYAYDFRIFSNTILLNQFSNGTSTVSSVQVPPHQPLVANINDYPYYHGQQPYPPPLPPGLSPTQSGNGTVYEVDCILNYIDSISLCLDSPDGVLSQVYDIPVVSTLQKDLVPIMGMPIDFLKGTPLLLGSLWSSEIYIVVRFKRPPPIKYYISFETGFINDGHITRQFRDHCIIIPGTVTYNRIIQYYNLKYTGGKLTLTA